MDSSVGEIGCQVISGTLFVGQSCGEVSLCNAIPFLEVGHGRNVRVPSRKIVVAPVLDVREYCMLKFKSMR